MCCSRSQADDECFSTAAHFTEPSQVGSLASSDPLCQIPAARQCFVSAQSNLKFSCFVALITVISVSNFACVTSRVAQPSLVDICSAFRKRKYLWLFGNFIQESKRLQSAAQPLNTHTSAFFFFTVPVTTYFC